MKKVFKKNIATLKAFLEIQILMKFTKQLPLPSNNRVNNSNILCYLLIE